MPSAFTADTISVDARVFSLDFLQVLTDSLVGGQGWRGVVRGTKLGGLRSSCLLQIWKRDWAHQDKHGEAGTVENWLQRPLGGTGSIAYQAYNVGDL